jgi:inward rectifier potassium channel
MSHNQPLRVPSCPSTIFSLETATTVGYGDMYPVDRYGRIVAGSEMMVGVAFTALTTGLLFVRFSRP